MASMIVERYDSSGLILQNKNSFKTNLAERGREKPSEKRIWLHSQKWSFKDVNGLSSRKNISTIESYPKSCLDFKRHPAYRQIYVGTLWIAISSLDGVIRRPLNYWSQLLRHDSINFVALDKK